MQRETLRLYRGDDYAFALSVRGADGLPVNLAGLRADLHAAAGGETVLQLSTENGLIRAAETPDGTPVLLLDFPRDLTAAADWTAADYDLQISDAQGRVRTIMRGRIRLDGDITPAPERLPERLPSEVPPPQTARPSATNWNACTHIGICIDDTQTVYLAAETGSNADLLAFYNLAKA